MLYVLVKGLEVTEPPPAVSWPISCWFPISSQISPSLLTSTLRESVNLAPYISKVNIADSIPETSIGAAVVKVDCP